MALTPRVLIIAGTDPTGGAGIVRDIETLSHFNVMAALAVTSINVQTDKSVETLGGEDANLIAAQINAAFTKDDIQTIKIGQICDAKAVEAIAKTLQNNKQCPIILDPVLAASSGGALVQDGLIDALKKHLMPLTTLITPNLLELAQLTQHLKPTKQTYAKLEDKAISQAQNLIQQTHVQAVLIKGGHAEGETSTDILLTKDSCKKYQSPRLKATMRGTGCALSSAIATQMALGKPLEDAVQLAKDYVFSKLSNQ